jgi:sortase A
VRVVINAGAVVWVVRLQRVLFALAVLMLGYSGFVVADTLVFQHREDARLEQLLRNDPAKQVGQPEAEDPLVPAVLPLPIEDGLIGRIGISRLGVSAIVMEGDDDIMLRRAVGHIAGTALPGEPGNVGIAGHRDSFFRPLQNIRDGDVITLTTPGEEFRYRVVSTRIVPPDDVSVLDSGSREVLTLVTCYPFYFVGPAPDRFIVRAERVI